MSLTKRVFFAAAFNFAAYFLTLAFPQLHKVAETIGKGIIDKDLVTPSVVFGALCGAMFWNVLTWVKGIPSSSSHALVGGIVGAGVAHAGMSGIQEWLSFYFKSPQVAPGLYPEHDLFIQQTKLKNTLREWMGEDAVTHSEAG